MQCKDIADEPILRFLAGEVDGYEGWPGKGWATCYRHEDGTPSPTSVLRAMPAGVPQKLARAKMGMLIKRGLSTGCTCGCRGDFEITAKGRAAIAA